jgi:hypothetical protein
LDANAVPDSRARWMNEEGSIACELLKCKKLDLDVLGGEPTGVMHGKIELLKFRFYTKSLTV